MNKRALIKSDLYRYTGSTGFKAFCKMYLKMPGFRFSVWLRLSKGSGIGCKLAKIIQIHYRYKFGIDIQPETEIGPVTIGNNCAIGANAVVTKDIPSHSTAVGIPAKVINQNGSDYSLLNTI